MPFENNPCIPDPTSKPLCCLPMDKASCLSKCQSPMQAFCKPARWCNSVTGDFGKCKRKWLIQGKSAAEVIEGLKEVINGLDAETKLCVPLRHVSAANCRTVNTNISSRVYLPLPSNSPPPLPPSSA